MQEDVTELDLRGLRCPLPALRTRKALRRARTGERMIVLSDDPLAALDIPHLCGTDGHRVVENTMVEGYRRFLIERGETRTDAERAGVDQMPGSE